MLPIINPELNLCEVVRNETFFIIFLFNLCFSLFKAIKCYDFDINCRWINVLLIDLWFIVVEICKKESYAYRKYNKVYIWCLLFKKKAHYSFILAKSEK